MQDDVALLRDCPYKDGISYFSDSGAYAVELWKEGCTHVLVDEGSAVTKMVIAAVAFSKPVLQVDWWQVDHLLTLLSIFAWWHSVQLVVYLLSCTIMEVLRDGCWLQKFSLETKAVTELPPYSRFTLT